MASRNTKQRKEVKDDDDDDEIKNIYDICGIPGLFKNILKFLNVKAILKMSESCLVKNLGHASFNECVSEAISKPKQLYELYQRYGNEFEGRSALICACQYGRMNDVLLFVNLHCFHKYIEMNGVKEGNMTLKEMVNQVERNSLGGDSIGSARNKYLVRSAIKAVEIIANRGCNSNTLLIKESNHPSRPDFLSMPFDRPVLRPSSEINFSLIQIMNFSLISSSFLEIKLKKIYFDFSFFFKGKDKIND